VHVVLVGANVRVVSWCPLHAARWHGRHKGHGHVARTVAEGGHMYNAQCELQVLEKVKIWWECLLWLAEVVQELLVGGKRLAAGKVWVLFLEPCDAQQLVYVSDAHKAAGVDLFEFLGDHDAFANFARDECLHPLGLVLAQLAANVCVVGSYDAKTKAAGASLRAELEAYVHSVAQRCSATVQCDVSWVGCLLTATFHSDSSDESPAESSPESPDESPDALLLSSLSSSSSESESP